MKILVISLAGIGNILMATPMIELLRRKETDARIVVLVMFKGSKELLETNPNIDEVIHWNFIKEGYLHSLTFLWSLRQEKFDLAILTYPANRIEYNVINFIIGAPKRIAHKYNHFFYRNLGFLNTDVIKEEDEKHDIEENVRLLSCIEEEPEEWSKPKIYLTLEDRQFVENWLRERELKNKLLIGIHAGTAEFKNQANRRWDKEKFGELGKRLVEKYGTSRYGGDNAQILLFGGKAEGELKADIKKLIDKGAEIVSDTTMRETSALISKCSIFISADSALMHTAASLDIPCVSIFGPTNIKWVYPYRTKYIVVRKELPCSPCFYYSQKPLECKLGDFRCIKGITVEEVLGAAVKLLQR